MRISDWVSVVCSSDRAFLEGQGYAVKAEIRGCDLVARRGEEPPVIVELKKAFNLALLLQGVDRLAVSDQVYLAFAAPTRAAAWRRDRRAIVKLCRWLGLGLLAVHPEAALVERSEEHTSELQSLMGNSYAVFCVEKQ